MDDRTEAQFPELEEPRPARRLRAGTRGRLTAVLAATAVAGVWYQAVRFSGLTTTSALFVGLPAALGLMVIHLPRTRSAYGLGTQVLLIFLAIVAPLLGEGAICILMAAPIFWAVTMLTIAVVQMSRSHRMSGVLVALPLLVGILEGRTDWLAPEPVVVETSRELPGSVEDWRARVRNAAPVPTNTSRFLSLGFPLPIEYARQEDRARIEFSESEGIRGAWQVAVEETDDGVVFRMLADTTPIAHWIDVVESRVRVRSAGAGRVAVVHATTFVPRLSPKAYFVPLERFALRRAHELALRTWSGAVE